MGKTPTARCCASAQWIERQFYVGARGLEMFDTAHLTYYETLTCSEETRRGLAGVGLVKSGDPDHRDTSQSRLAARDNDLRSLHLW